MGADAKKAKGVDVEGAAAAAAAGACCAGTTHATAEAEDRVPVVVESAFSP